MVKSRLIIPTIDRSRRRTKTRPRFGCSKIKRKPAELFLLVGAKIALLAEQLAEQAGQFVQVFRDRRFDDDIAHAHMVYSIIGRRWQCGFAADRLGLRSKRLLASLTNPDSRP